MRSDCVSRGITHHGSFRRVVSARERLTQEDVDWAGRQAESAGIAVLAGENFLQLLFRRRVQVGKCPSLRGDENDWRRSHRRDYVSRRNNGVGDGIMSAEVKCQDVGSIGGRRTGVTAL